MGKVRSRVRHSSRNRLLSTGVLLLCLKSFSDLIGRKRARLRGPPRLAHGMRVKRIPESSATPSLKSTACAPASNSRRSTNGRGRIKTFARVGQTWGVARNESLQARLPASAPNRGCLGSAESRWVRDCRNVHRRPRSPRVRTEQCAAVRSYGAIGRRCLHCIDSSSASNPNLHDPSREPNKAAPWQVMDFYMES